MVTRDNENSRQDSVMCEMESEKRDLACSLSHSSLALQVSVQLVVTANQNAKSLSN